MVRGEDGGTDTPQEEERDQPVDDVESKRLPSRQQHHCDDQSCDVQHQLLRHEVPIELEHLVGQRDDHNGDEPCLDDQPDHAIRHPGNMRQTSPEKKSPALVERGFREL